MLEDAARGRFPAPDGSVELLPPPPGPAMAVVGFSAHHFIAGAAPEDWVRSRLPHGEPAAPFKPSFLAALGEQLGRTDDGVDLVLAANGLPEEPGLAETAGEDHPRVARARRHREAVRAFGDERGCGVVILGRGLTLRTEVAVEVDEAHRGAGHGRRLFTEARKLVAPDEVVFAQTAPAHVASLHALLGAGFRPIGAEVLFV